MEQYVYLIVILIVTFLLLFIQQYFIQKGKNLATKEDVKTITKDIETIKRKLDITTTNKKWFLNEQNKIIMQLTRKVFEVNDELMKFPNYEETSETNLINKYYTITREKLNAENLGFYHLKLFVRDDAILKNTAAYYDQLLEILNKKKEVLDKINSATQRARAPIVDDETQDNIHGEYVIEGALMQPEEYTALLKEYMEFYSRKVHGDEWNSFIASVREFLKSTDRV